MNIKESIYAAQEKNKDLKALVISFTRDASEKYFIFAVEKQDKSVSDKLYSSLSEVGKLYIYAVTRDALKILDIGYDSNEFAIAVQSMVSDPIKKEMTSASDEAIEKIANEYERSIKEHSA